MDIREIKNALRKEYLDKRRAIPADKRQTIDEAVCRALLASEVFQKARVLLAYAPKAPEVNVFPLIESALSMGKKVAFPRCEKEYALSFHYASPDQLEVGLFGISEPSDQLPFCRDFTDSICLVPALLFDEEGYRLGYGKGYYDRFLANYNGQTVGIVRNGFILPKLPRGRFDRAVDIIVSETGVRFLQ